MASIELTEVSSVQDPQGDGAVEKMSKAEDVPLSEISPSSVCR